MVVIFAPMVAVPLISRLARGLVLPTTPDSLIPLLFRTESAWAPFSVPLSVSAPKVLIVVSSVSVMLPDAMAAALLELRRAPVFAEPVPARLKAFATVRPLRSSEPPEDTMTAAVPSAPERVSGPDVTEFAPALRMPLSMFVPPEYVLAPLRVSVPEPSLVREPAPVMTPE